MAKSKGVVGIIGLGIMGGSFARNLVKSGWRVIGYDISEARRKELARAGVTIADGIPELAAAVPIVITSLPKPEALAAVAESLNTTSTPPAPPSTDSYCSFFSRSARR